MTRVSCTTTIDASAETVWRTISDFGGAARYLYLVAQCMVEGKGVGALRTLTSEDGSVIVERLEALNDDAHRLSYLLLTETPFRDCLTTMEVHDLDPGHCEVEWSATFEAAGIPPDEARTMLEAALVENCLALKHFLEQ